jgi:hypothetical protein
MSQSNHVMKWTSLAELEQSDNALLKEICSTYDPTKEFLVFLELTVTKRFAEKVWQLARIPLRETVDDGEDEDGVRETTTSNFY